MFLMPESPYFLAQNGKIEEMKCALEWLLCGDPTLIAQAKADIKEYLKHHDMSFETTGVEDTESENTLLNMDSSQKSSTSNEDGTPKFVASIDQNDEKNREIAQSGAINPEKKDSDFSSHDVHACYKLMVMSVIMAYARLNGVSQITNYMVDMLENARVTEISATSASAGISIFEAVGKNVHISHKVTERSKASHCNFRVSVRDFIIRQSWKKNSLDPLRGWHGCDQLFPVVKPDWNFGL